MFSLTGQVLIEHLQIDARAVILDIRTEQTERTFQTYVTHAEAGATKWTKCVSLALEMTLLVLYGTVKPV